MSTSLEITPACILAYLSKLGPQPDELLTRLETEARAEGIPIIDPVAGEFIELITRMLRPERALEIGTAIGYTTIRIARALSD